MRFSLTDKLPCASHKSCSYPIILSLPPSFPSPPPVKLPRSTKNDKRGRVAQLPRANISLRHEIYIQRCALSARSVTRFASRFPWNLRFENHFRFDRFSRAKISKWNESAMLKHDRSENRLRGMANPGFGWFFALLLPSHAIEEKRKTKRNFQRRCMSSPCISSSKRIRMFVTWAPNMARKGDWTRIFNSAKEVASFVLRLSRGSLVSSDASSGTINVQLAPSPPYIK